MKPLLTIFALWLIATTARAQTTYPEQDCIGAIKICDEAAFTVPVTYVGDGNIAELGYGAISPVAWTCLSNGENNSSWFYFEIDSPGMVVFDIIPLTGDDYDFSIYLIDSNHSCADIRDTNFMPARCSYAANVNTLPTGLRFGYSQTTAGVADSAFLRPLTVQAGEKYYMVIDNFNNGGGGYNLDFTGTTAKFDADTTAHLIYRQFVNYSTVYAQNLRIYFSAPFNCDSISYNPADYAITGPTNIAVDSVSFQCDSTHTQSSYIDIFYTGIFEDDSVYYFSTANDGAEYTPNNVPASCVQTYLVTDSVYAFTANVLPIDSFGFIIDTVPPSQSDGYFYYDIYTQPIANYYLTFSDTGYVHNVNNRIIQFTTSGTKEVCAVAWRQLYADTICKTIGVVLSTEDVQMSNKFLLAPNPVKNQLQISTSLNGNNETQYQIINTLGATAMTSKATAKDFSIDVSTLPTGIYFIHLQSGNAKTVKRFVKE